MVDLSIAHQDQLPEDKIPDRRSRDPLHPGTGHLTIGRDPQMVRREENQVETCDAAVASGDFNSWL